ncbi:MHYT domain-containing protein [Aquabacter sp. CN5-332]|uniref:MHYT domain-containing protein n=1 Tax=Aquabacter sp. CN5-332 TaxID=3156608 RepID=UPI0032B3BEDC
MALSVLVAIQGAYVGLSLAVRIKGTDGSRRRIFLAASSICLAVAIWSMHFVGMLAARLPFPVDYLVFPTLLSVLVCVLVVGIGIFAATAGRLTPLSLAAAATFMGLGIASMHYIGMQALHASAHMEHAPLFVAASVIIAIAASALALRLAARSGRPPLFLSAVALGIAISGMHYTAMAGMTIFPHPDPQPLAPALSPDLLAIVVAVVAFLVSGLFLLVLVPDRPDRDEVALGVPAGPAETMPEPPPRHGGQHLPVERDRAIYLLPVEEIVAVRANAHYTSVFDGTATYFCSHSISEVEARLADTRFVRVHRSHIINLDRVVALKNTGDNCQIELTSGGEAYLVPVSRSRTAWLKSQFGLKTGHAVS